MFTQRTFLALALCAAMAVPSAAVEKAEPCCFSGADFGQELTGICVTAVPESGVLRLGSRVIRSGDVLTAQQLDGLTFSPAAAREDTAAVRYLPMNAEGLLPEAELVISIRSRKNEPPTAEDSKLETYKNLPNEGLLTVSDPEGDALTFTLTRLPRRGEVILRDDGSFLYTPKKNKVGTDSFVFTATDSAGNVSREATVTVDILRPTDEQQYTDTISSDCRFEAEWLRSQGLFSGETVNGQFCFSPAESVSRGQFLVMLMEVLELPVDRRATQTGFLDESPQWLKPYLAAALRSGIISGYPAEGGVEFRAERPVSADEAAAMIQNALQFAVPAAAMDGTDNAIQILPLGMDPLTRGQAAKTLYALDQLRRASSGFFGIFR